MQFIYDLIKSWWTQTQTSWCKMKHLSMKASIPPWERLAFCWLRQTKFYLSHNTSAIPQKDSLSGWCNWAVRGMSEKLSHKFDCIKFYVLQCQRIIHGCTQCVCLVSCTPHAKGLRSVSNSILLFLSTFRFFWIISNTFRHSCDCFSFIVEKKAYDCDCKASLSVHLTSITALKY